MRQPMGFGQLGYLVNFLIPTSVNTIISKGPNNSIEKPSLRFETRIPNCDPKNMQTAQRTKLSQILVKLILDRC